MHFFMSSIGVQSEALFAIKSKICMPKAIKCTCCTCQCPEGARRSYNSSCTSCIGRKPSNRRFVCRRPSSARANPKRSFVIALLTFGEANKSSICTPFGARARRSARRFVAPCLEVGTSAIANQRFARKLCKKI